MQVRKVVAVLFLVLGILAMIRGFTQFLDNHGSVTQFVLLEAVAIMLVGAAGWLWELGGGGR